MASARVRMPSSHSAVPASATVGRAFISTMLGDETSAEPSAGGATCAAAGESVSVSVSVSVTARHTVRANAIAPCASELRAVIGRDMVWLRQAGEQRGRKD